MSTIDERIAEAEARLEAAREADRAYRDEQDKRDMLAVLEAKEKYGEHAVAVLELVRKAPGLPGLCIARTPDKIEHKRFRDMATQQKVRHAIELLQSDCRVYPDDATFKQMRDVFQHLPEAIADAAIALAKGGAKEEGKV